MKTDEFFTAEMFRALIGGRIFTAEFTKKDGTVRKIRARLGVKKGLKGGELKYDPADFNNLIVWDLDKKDYRTIKFDNLRNIKYDGTEEVFE
jgi:hypothetical protein